VGARHTGRLSCKMPNLQQLPSKTKLFEKTDHEVDLAHMCRECFIPDEGQAFVKLDYSGQENRVVAHFAFGKNGEFVQNEYIKNPYFDEHFDGIVYAVCVGLGFAAIENVAYVLKAEDWAGVAITRALLAVPGHYAFAILMGYYYSIYHFVDHSPKVAARVLLAPVVAHGIYDSLAMSGLVNQYVGGLSFCFLIFFCIKIHKVAKTKMLAQIKRDKRKNDTFTLQT
jgi:hypothetical protein